MEHFSNSAPPHRAAVLTEEIPGTSAGAPRPPRRSSRRWRNLLWLPLGLAFGCLVFWNATRPYFYFGYFALSVVGFISAMVRRTRARRPY
jgi:hypothetical protein